MLNRSKSNAESDPTVSTSSDDEIGGLLRRRHTKAAPGGENADSMSSWLAEGDTPNAEPEVQPIASVSMPEPTIEDLLRRLDAGPDPDADSSTELESFGDTVRRNATEPVYEHADALNAAERARQEAHDLLSLAKSERDRASAVATKLYEEARQSAARLIEGAKADAEDMREETRREAAETRASIETVVAEFRRAAARDAERLHAEAAVSAMEDARKAARIYVSRAAALGVRDAERHRAEMAGALESSSQAATAAHATMNDFAATLSDFTNSMAGHLAALEAAVETARQQRDAVGGLLPISLDESRWGRLGVEDLTDAELVDLPVAFRPGEPERPVGATDDTAVDDPSAPPQPAGGSLYDGPTL